MSNPPPSTYTFNKSLELFERAKKVIPGGIYGHTTPALVNPLQSPYYATRGKGCRYWDADDNEFIDFMCAYGPIVLGYQHPNIEAAAAQQSRHGDCFNQPTSAMVDLAEDLVNRVDFADWSVFGKNGSDMTTWALQVAREHTQRKKILTIQGAYHGIDPWCTPGNGGLIEEDRQHIHSFPWNDKQALDTLLKEHPKEIAAVILTPYHHPAFGNSQFSADDFLQHVQAQCNRHEIVLILDDVRAGFRLDLGGSHRAFDFTPDLSCYCKAIANGHALSACVGNADLRPAANKVFLTGSFWNGAVSMAAALETLRILENENALAHIAAMGQRLTQGLAERAAQHGLQITLSGPPAMPNMTFANETNFFRSQHFTAAAIQRGAFFHPHHNWFLCAAHQPADIDAALDIANQAFASVKTTFGS